MITITRQKTQIILSDKDSFEDTQTMSLVIQLMSTYPMLKASNVTVDNAVIFGGVRLANKTSDKHGSRPIKAASAIRLVYVLAPGRVTTRASNIAKISNGRVAKTTTFNITLPLL